MSTKLGLVLVPRTLVHDSCNRQVPLLVSGGVLYGRFVVQPTARDSSQQFPNRFLRQSSQLLKMTLVKMVIHGTHNVARHAVSDGCHDQRSMIYVGTTNYDLCGCNDLRAIRSTWVLPSTHNNLHIGTMIYVLCGCHNLRFTWVPRSTIYDPNECHDLRSKWVPRSTIYDPNGCHDLRSK